MGDVLLAIGVVTLLFVVAWVALTAVTVRRLHRRNRVSRAQQTRPPLPWLASPSACARLHRRLRDAVGVVRIALPPPSRRRKIAPELRALATAADDLEVHAAALDRDLMLAARVRGPSGQQLRARLTEQVTEVERLAVRISTAATAASPDRPGARPTPAALAELAEQLDALEAARDEIARLEARVGLPQSTS